MALNHYLMNKKSSNQLKVAIVHDYIKEYGPHFVKASRGKGAGK